MKIIYVLLLLAFLHQSDASKKGGKRTVNLLKKGVPLLALLYSIAPQNNNPALCPSVPTRNGVELINYVRCYQNQEPEFEKYLMNADKCHKVNSLYKKAQELRKCVLGVPSVILQGVKSRLFATVTEPDNLEMLKAHLKSLEKIDTKGLERLAKKAEQIKKLNFFQVKQAAEFFQKHKDLSPEKAFKEGLKSEYQNVEFDNTEELIEITKQMHPDDHETAVKEALKSEHQSLNLKKVKQLIEITSQMHKHKWRGVKEAMKPEHQSLDVKKVEQLIDITSQIFLSDYGAVKEALKPEYQSLDVNEGKEMIEIIKQIFSSDRGTKDALKPEYQSLDVKKVQQLIEITSQMHKHKWKVVKEALKPEYQSLDVSKVEQLIEITKQIYPYNYGAVQEALKPEYQSLNLKKVKRLIKITKQIYPYNYKAAVKEAMKPEYQDVHFADLNNIDLVIKTGLKNKFGDEDFDFVEELLELLQKVFQKKDALYRETLMPRYLNLSITEISNVVEASLRSKHPISTYRQKISELAIHKPKQYTYDDL